jgi:hypothetical protein
MTNKFRLATITYRQLSPNDTIAISDMQTFDDGLNFSTIHDPNVIGTTPATWRRDTDFWRPVVVENVIGG